MKPTEPQTNNQQEDGSAKIAYEVLGVDVPIEDMEHVYACMRRIRKIENVDAAVCKRLTLTSCLVESLEGVQELDLEALELYQNKVSRIECLEGMRNLRVLDLSFNMIRRIENLSGCTSLDTLILANNKIEEMNEELRNFKLKHLELGSNRLRKVSNIDHMRETLEELWVGRNKITSMALPTLERLRIVSFQNNRLSDWEPSLFAACPELEELYVSENNLGAPPPEIRCLKKLHTLDIARNRVASLDYIGEMTALKELWLNDNQIESLDEIVKLKGLVNLSTIYLERNPIQTKLGEDYEKTILSIFPNLEQLDARYLTGVKVKGADDARSA